jgi:hypothetical protein
MEFDSELPNPLTPPSPLWGEGDHVRCPRHFFAVRRSRNVHAASLLPRREKDRLRGFGRRSLILKLPNPLTPPSPPRGEGDRNHRPVVTFLLTNVSS